MVAKYSKTEVDAAVESSLNKAVSHTYIADGDETPIALTAGTPAKYTLPVTAGYFNKFGVANPGQPTQALQYTGEQKILCSIEASTSMIASSNNSLITFYAYKNGSPIPGASIQRKIGTGADAGAMALTFISELEEGDLIDVYVESDINTSLTLYKTNFVLEEIKPIGVEA